MEVESEQEIGKEQSDKHATRSTESIAQHFHTG